MVHNYVHLLFRCTTVLSSSCPLQLLTITPSLASDPSPDLVQVGWRGSVHLMHANCQDMHHMHHTQEARKRVKESGAGVGAGGIAKEHTS